MSSHAIDTLPPWAQRRIVKAKKRVRELALPDERDMVAVRRRLAERYLRGSGYEIGALHIPLKVPRHVNVRYVDRMSIEDLRREFPELRELDVVAPDVIDDGERLGTLPDESADFIVANHFIEHTQDPISTLRNHFRVLRPGGIEYMAVPDKRYTFDKDRPVTMLSHVLRDAQVGPEWSRRGHFEEWARLVKRVPESQVVATARELQDADYSIHFHVWRATDFLELLLHCRSMGLPLEIEAMERNGHEFVVIMRKSYES